MKYLFIPFLIVPTFAYPHQPAHKVGNICHAENSNLNYAGLWELSVRGNLICNYWQFLGEQKRTEIESKLDEYGEPPEKDELFLDETKSVHGSDWEIDYEGDDEWEYNVEDDIGDENKAP